MVEKNKNSDDAELLEQVRKERETKELVMYGLFSDYGRNLWFTHHNSNVNFQTNEGGLPEIRELIYYANMGIDRARKNTKLRWSPDKNRKILGPDGKCVDELDELTEA